MSAYYASHITLTQCLLLHLNELLGIKQCLTLLHSLTSSGKILRVYLSTFYTEEQNSTGKPPQLAGLKNISKKPLLLLYTCVIHLVHGKLQKKKKKRLFTPPPPNHLIIFKKGEGGQLYNHHPSVKQIIIIKIISKLHCQEIFQ